LSNQNKLTIVEATERQRRTRWRAGLGWAMWAVSVVFVVISLVTLPPAGALGITVVIGYVAARRQRDSRPVPSPGHEPASVPGDASYPGSGQPGRGPNRADANHTTRASGTSSTTGSSPGT